MKASDVLFMAIASLMLLACSPDNSAKTKLFEDQRNALDKAKTVEKTVQQQMQETRQNEEKQTQ